MGPVSASRVLEPRIPWTGVSENGDVSTLHLGLKLSPAHAVVRGGQGTPAGAGLGLGLQLGTGPPDRGLRSHAHPSPNGPLAPVPSSEGVKLGIQTDWLPVLR